MTSPVWWARWLSCAEFDKPVGERSLFVDCGAVIHDPHCQRHDAGVHPREIGEQYSVGADMSGFGADDGERGVDQFGGTRVVAGTRVGHNTRRRPRADGLRRFGIAAQTGRVGGIPTGVAADPATGAVGEGAARAVVGADEQAVDAAQLDGLGLAEVPPARDLCRVPGSSAAMADTGPILVVHPSRWPRSHDTPSSAVVPRRQ